METNILVIDDSADDYAFFERSFLSSGISATVSLAQDGVSGFAAAADEKIDCIFLDYHLPGMNGLEVLKKIRAQGIDKPVIMLTGQKEEHTIVELLKAGANDYISKYDLTPEALRISIENSQEIYKIKKEKLLADQALKESQLRLAEAQEIACLGHWEYDFTTKELILSEVAQNMLAYDHQKSTFPMHAFIRHQVQPDNIALLTAFIRDLKKNNSHTLTLRIKTFNSEYKYIHIKKRVSEDMHSAVKIIGTIQDITILKKALEETKKAKISRKATTWVLTIGIFAFLVSEAVIDPFVDALEMGLIIAFSFKGGIALFLKPLETILEKMMLKKIVPS